MALYWITITLLVMYSRVFLHYHTVEQVIAGGTLGAVCAIFHHVVIVRWLVDTHVWPYLSQENATTARWLRYWRVRDTTHVPDVIGVEYEAAQKVATEKLAKQAKRVSLRKLRKAK